MLETLGSWPFGKLADKTLVNVEPSFGWTFLAYPAKATQDLPREERDLILAIETVGTYLGIPETEIAQKYYCLDDPQITIAMNDGRKIGILVRVARLPDWPAKPQVRPFAWQPDVMYGFASVALWPGGAYEDGVEIFGVDFRGVEKL